MSGFHDFGFRFFWPLLKRGARRHTKLYGRPMTARETETGAHLSVDDFGRPVEVDYRYLAWNDISARRIKQPLWQIYWHMIYIITKHHIDGKYFRLMRGYWGFTNGVYYMLFTMLISSALTYAGALLVFGLIDPFLSVAPFAKHLACAIAAYFAPSLFYEKYEGHFRVKLMWLIFRMNLDHIAGKAPDLDERLIDFKDQVAKALATDDADEVVICGHSYGSILAVQVAGEALAKLADDQPERLPEVGEKLALLTIGDINAMHAIFGPNSRYTPAYRQLLETPGVSWLSLFSPQDGLNFPRHNVAVKELGFEKAHLPNFRSTRIRELLTAENYKKMRRSFWDMHFQYFREFDVQGAYSYFRLIGAARPLKENYGVRPEEEAYAKKATH